MRIFTFDTTLRDGTQGESLSFSADDKLLVLHKLDELGIDYVEGGWPGSNPKDKDFFARAKEVTLKHARLTAFGATRLVRNTVEEDASVNALVEAGTPVVCIFGKSWDLHVRRALNISENENLQLISDTVRYLKAHGKEVVYDAEHFFDGYKAGRDLALRTLEAAKSAGADVLVLCDTNGGMLPSRLAEICADVRKNFDGVLGIHAHDDSDVGVANTLAAVEHGFAHVQGCINGYGERCGNANLTSIIANLEVKMGHTTIGKERLANLTATARFIAELANLPMRNEQPIVGHGAFAHKGGVQVSASIEYINPKAVGNYQRVLPSDLSGRGSVLYMLKHHGLEDRGGYELEAAEGTFEMLMRETLQPGAQAFEVVSYEVTTSSNGSTATVTLKAQDGVHSATASGNGPVNALDMALRQCLSALCPAIAGVRLHDYKVRVLDFKKGTAAQVRVLIEWSDNRRNWCATGVSENVIEASWFALVDALRLELLRLSEQDENLEQAVEDYCSAATPGEHSHAAIQAHGLAQAFPCPPLRLGHTV